MQEVAHITDASKRSCKKRNRFCSFGAYVVIFIAIVALFAPVIANEKPLLTSCGGKYYLPALSNASNSECDIASAELILMAPIKYGPSSYDLNNVLSAPSREHLLGTDGDGRDVLALLVWGARVSIVVGFAAVAISLLIGVTLGAIAGFAGGAVDIVISRFIEVVFCFPAMFLVLALLAFVGPSLFNIVIVIGLTGWTQVARLVRAEVQRLAGVDFVLAARAEGMSFSGIVFKHLIPNSLVSVFVVASFGVASAVLAESALSFLGFGVAVSTASWGNMLSQAWEYVDVAWWLTLAPGSAIFALVASLNAVGEKLRDR